MKSTTAKSNASQKGNRAVPKDAQKNGSKAAQGLRDLFEDELKDIYWAEKALTKAIPRMAKNATSEELVSALNDHLEVTRGHVERLEESFKILGKAARAKKCDAMEGLVKEAEGIMEDTEEGVVRDAGIISAAQKVEHYEIATYGTLCAFAKTLGEDEVATLLHQTLDEEKEADQTLTEIAESSINVEAEEQG
jgi:ferritin-like metal-binding protein YciE